MPNDLTRTFACLDFPPDRGTGRRSERGIVRPDCDSVKADDVTTKSRRHS